MAATSALPAPPGPTAPPSTPAAHVPAPAGASPLAALVARSPRLQAALRAPDSPRRILQARFPPAEFEEVAVTFQKCWRERCRRRSALMGRGQVGGAAARRAEICSPLRASLHPHQLDGVRWLFKAFCRGGGILADDPGLGKTLQTIAVVEALTRARLASTVLVVVPANLVKNWEAELRRWLGRTKFRLDVASACARTGAVQPPLPDGAMHVQPHPAASTLVLMPASTPR